MKSLVSQVTVAFILFIKKKKIIINTLKWDFLGYLVVVLTKLSVKGVQVVFITDAELLTLY